MYELLELALEDENISGLRREYMQEKKEILENISAHDLLISKVRRHFIQDKIDLDDFNALKNEYKEVLNYLKDQLRIVNEKLACCQSSKDINGIKGYGQNIFALYENKIHQVNFALLNYLHHFQLTLSQRSYIHYKLAML